MVKDEANSAFMNSILCHCVPGLGRGKAHPVCRKRSGSKWLQFPSQNSANSHLKMSPARVNGINMNTYFNEHYTDCCFHCENLVIFWKGCPASRGDVNIKTNLKEYYIGSIKMNLSEHTRPNTNIWLLKGFRGRMSIQAQNSAASFHPDCKSYYSIFRSV